MKRTFKRTINFKLCITMLLMILLSIVLLEITSNTDNTVFIKSLYLSRIILSYIILPILLLITFVTDFFIWPDFKISVVKKNGYLIFELAKNDHRIIKINNLKINKKISKLILSDGNSIMEIPYNKELFNFLMRVSK